MTTATIHARSSSDKSSPHSRIGYKPHAVIEASRAKIEPNNNEGPEEDEVKKRNLIARRAEDAMRPIKKYYVDELGFYRHLDPDQREYVCSNISAANLKPPKNRAAGGPSDNSKNGRRSDAIADNNIYNGLGRLGPAGGDGGYQQCYGAIRHDLGISHFDRTDDYKQWKKGWDEYMKAKMTAKVPVTLNRELKLRIRSGIPHDYRYKVWTALIRMRTRHIRARFGDDVYRTLSREVVPKIRINATSCEQTNNGDNPGAPESKIEKWFKQIELDLLRTLPNNRHFEDPNSRGVQRVRRILRAYACFNQTVGYCQGMNRLAAMALLVLPEEEAFWCLVAIIQCIMPKDYYLKPWLAQVDCCVLSDLLEKKLPKLHRHLVRNDIQLTLFTWFFTIFVDGFRPELILRIWDCFLLEGDKVLFRFALSILHISQDELLNMNDFSAMSNYLTRISSTRKLEVEQLFESK